MSCISPVVLSHDKRFGPKEIQDKFQILEFIWRQVKKKASIYHPSVHVCQFEHVHLVYSWTPGEQFRLYRITTPCFQMFHMDYRALTKDSYGSRLSKTLLAWHFMSFYSFQNSKRSASCVIFNITIKLYPTLYNNFSEQHLTSLYSRLLWSQNTLFWRSPAAPKLFSCSRGSTKRHMLKESIFIPFKVVVKAK